jgi:hypothetical protein
MPAAKQEQQDRRILAVIGDDYAPREMLLARWNEYLNSELAMPLLVTGIEDFRWEEFYVIGRGDPLEYESLRSEQPSYTDIFELTAIDRVGDHTWSLFHEDLKAHVRRTSDGKRFILGVCELKAVDRRTVGYRLLNDYSVWFVNSL